MILLTKFQAKQITFGCATAKSYLADMYSHPMIHQCFTCISLKNHSINFIFWKSALLDFRQILITSPIYRTRSIERISLGSY